MSSNYDYLYVEFPIKEGKTLCRMRYKVVPFPLTFDSKITIFDRGSAFYGSTNLCRKNSIRIGRFVSEDDLFETVRKHIAEKFNVSSSLVKLRWESNSLKFQKN